MSERNKQTNFLPARRDTRTATVVCLRSAGRRRPFYDFGYTGGLFISGRS